jgi:hypothetical protein
MIGNAKTIAFTISTQTSTPGGAEKAMTNRICQQIGYVNKPGLPMTREAGEPQKKRPPARGAN